MSNWFMEWHKYPRNRKSIRIRQPETLDSRQWPTFPGVGGCIFCIFSRMILHLFDFLVPTGLIEMSAHRINLLCFAMALKRILWLVLANCTSLAVLLGICVLRDDSDVALLGYCPVKSYCQSAWHWLGSIASLDALRLCIGNCISMFVLVIYIVIQCTYQHIQYTCRCVLCL